MIANKILLNLIILLHVLCVLFIVCIPFCCSSNYFLLVHIIVIPFIILHWILNNNACSLTLAEQYVRAKIYNTTPDPTECFTHKFIAPIYDFNKNNKNFSNIIYIFTIMLLCISIYKLYNNYRIGKLNSFYDIFII